MRELPSESFLSDEKKLAICEMKLPIWGMKSSLSFTHGHRGVFLGYTTNNYRTITNNTTIE